VRVVSRPTAFLVCAFWLIAVTSVNGALLVSNPTAGSFRGKAANCAGTGSGNAGEAGVFHFGKKNAQGNYISQNSAGFTTSSPPLSLYGQWSATITPPGGAGQLHVGGVNWSNDCVGRDFVKGRGIFRSG
jgi:hypothetical protein